MRERSRSEDGYGGAGKGKGVWGEEKGCVREGVREERMNGR